MCAATRCDGMSAHQITSFFLLAELCENLLNFFQVTKVYANPVDINVDSLFLPFRLDLGNGIVSLLLFPAIQNPALALGQ